MSAASSRWTHGLCAATLVPDSEHNILLYGCISLLSTALQAGDPSGPPKCGGMHLHSFTKLSAPLDFCYRLKGLPSVCYKLPPHPLFLMALSYLRCPTGLQELPCQQYTDVKLFSATHSFGNAKRPLLAARILSSGMTHGRLSKANSQVLQHASLHESEQQCNCMSSICTALD